MNVALSVTMAQTEISGLSGPVTGYFLTTILLILFGINLFGDKLDLFYLGDCTFIYAILGVLILIVAGLCLKNWYLMSGYLFLLIAIETICMSIGSTIWSYEFGDAVNIVMFIAIMMIAFMCYRMEEDIQMTINILLGVMLILSMSVFDDMSVILSIISIVCGCLTAYMCYSTWSMIQDMDAEYEGKLPIKKG